MNDEFEQHCVICAKCQDEYKRAQPNDVNDMNLCRIGRRILIKLDPRINALLPNTKLDKLN